MTPAEALALWGDIECDAGFHSTEDDAPVDPELVPDRLADFVWPAFAYGNCGAATNAFILTTCTGRRWSYINDADGFKHHAVLLDDGTVIDWTWAQWHGKDWGARPYEPVDAFPLVLPLAEYEDRFLVEVAGQLSSDTVEEGRQLIIVTDVGEYPETMLADRLKVDA